MAPIRLTTRAFVHLEQILEFVAASDPERALLIIQRIREAVMMLERHPLIGRPAEDGRSELIVSRGRSAHVVLYRWLPADEAILVLAVREARQAGCPLD